LYNWYAVNTGKLAPQGWHVPTENEWITLENFLGGFSVAGGKIKETGTFHWSAPNTGATNESEFIGLPGGQRSVYDGTFVNINIVYNLWSSTSDPDYNQLSLDFRSINGLQ